MSERKWFVASGPDSRHLIEYAGMFDRMRDAKAAYESRTDRAKELYSMDFEPWQCGTNKRVLRQEIA